MLSTHRKSVRGRLLASTIFSEVGNSLISRLKVINLLHNVQCYRYGFKGPPNLTLVAKPKLGNREVKLSRVTHWIERKLQELVNVSHISIKLCLHVSPIRRPNC